MSHFETCPECYGRGNIDTANNNNPQEFEMCGVCGGRGKIHIDEDDESEEID